MTWGIMVYETCGNLYSFVMADDSFYEGMKEGDIGGKFLGGRKGITDESIDEISNSVNDLTRRSRNGESLDLEKELELVFSEQNPI